MKQKSSRDLTKIMVLTAILTALVIVLQLLGSFIRFGMFSISLVLLPIVIGAAVCGVGAGAWLGFVFGVAVLLSGDAAAFLPIDPFGTVLTVLVKGTAAGLCSGLVFRGLSALVKPRANGEGKSANGVFLPVIAAAIICPIVNSGIFLVGCNLFFYETVAEWGAALGYAKTADYMILGLVGGNFLVEMLINVILSPGIVRLLAINKRIFNFT